MSDFNRSETVAGQLQKSAVERQLTDSCFSLQGAAVSSSTIPTHIVTLPGCLRLLLHAHTDTHVVDNI